MSHGFIGMIWEMLFMKSYELVGQHGSVRDPLLCMEG